MIRRRVAFAALCLALLSSINGHFGLAPSAFATPQAQSSAPSAAKLDALSGEYTNAVEPDTPMSFYVHDGKLVIESERLVPTELTPVSDIEFSQPNSKATLKFTLDPGGRGTSVVDSEESDATLRRTGEPVHHLFHDYQRSEAMIPSNFSGPTHWP